MALWTLPSWQCGHSASYLAEPIVTQCHAAFFDAVCSVRRARDTQCELRRDFLIFPYGARIKTKAKRAAGAWRTRLPISPLSARVDFDFFWPHLCPQWNVHRQHTVLEI